MDGSSASRAAHHLGTSNLLHAHRVSSCNERHVTINILPQDVLLLIFYFDRLIHIDGLGLDLSLCPLWKWHRLVHVCQRWRSIVFASPKFLDLKLVCGPSTPVKLIYIWPLLPIIVRDRVGWRPSANVGFDVAFVHHNRVCEINLHLTSSQLQRLARKQFPALIHLRLGYLDLYGASALPDGSFNGSTPRLQSLGLHSIPFPALPKLLLSITHLVHLTLWKIPPSGYLSPETLVIGLAVSTNLKFLVIGFEFRLSLHDRGSRRPSLPTRTVLPALTQFEFQGVGDYLEDLVARIDTPLLDSIWITFVRHPIIDIPQLAHFLRRTTRFEALKEAHVDLDGYDVQVESFPPTRTSDANSALIISCRQLYWPVPSLTQVFTSFFTSIYMVEDLYIFEPQKIPPRWQDDIENIEWLEIFRPFTAVKNLYICEKFAQQLASSLQALVGKSDKKLSDSSLSHDSFLVNLWPFLTGTGQQESYDVNFDERPPHSISPMFDVM